MMMKTSHSDPLTDPIRIMIKSDSLGHGGGFSSGWQHPPSVRLYNFCVKHRMKVEEPRSQPFDRMWITVRTVDQKVKLINYLGLDLLARLAEQKSE